MTLRTFPVRLPSDYFERACVCAYQFAIAHRLEFPNHAVRTEINDPAIVGQSTEGGPTVRDHRMKQIRTASFFAA